MHGVIIHHVAEHNQQVTSIMKNVAILEQTVLCIGSV